MAIKSLCQILMRIPNILGDLFSISVLCREVHVF
jgi:hypothetical protein